MATKVDRISKIFNELESQKTLLTVCTNGCQTLSNHFSSLQQTLDSKSQTLDSKLQTLDSKTEKTLETLEERERSISDRESTAISHVEQLRDAAVAELENPADKNLSLSESLRSFCRKMDSGGLWKFLVSKRKDMASLKPDIAPAILNESVDATCLLLDAVEDFVCRKSGDGRGVSDQRWACGMLIREILPAESPPRSFAAKMLDRGAEIAEKWKEKMDGDAGPAEAQMLLQMVAGLGIWSRFDESWMKGLVLEYASRRDMPKIAVKLGFGDKIGDIIDELIKSGKDLDAIYFAYESGLTERFPPVPLLKASLKNARKNANSILKNGHHSPAAMEEAGTSELNSLKAIIKCVEEHKLESEFSLESHKNRVAQLEKAKADRKKNANANKPQNKRARGSLAGSGHAFRPSKVGRFASSIRHNPASAHQNLAADYPGSYDYPTQGISAFGGGAPGVSPAAITQPYSGASYGGAASYGVHDYGSVLPSQYLR
eukprot:TRINITY_DN9837_c0_g1_i1.p1 TRINITY_DN9837_c0_g1~~TRINITY_DN9837_c0_g1_i1.p1  ORF type:complete len:488 (-),score=71.12 TRINITY_DN9837_c0_g1_i1:292-1755(-)